MGQYAGFVIRVDCARVSDVEATLISLGAKDIRAYKELGLLVGIIKGTGCGEAIIKLHRAEADEFRCLGQNGLGDSDDFPASASF